MAVLSMLLVDADERYVERMAMKFLEGMEDEIQLEIITDMNYLKEYAATPRKIDVLIINEGCITEDIAKQNIKLTIVLKEEETFEEQKGAYGIYRYSNLQEIYYKVQGKMNHTFAESDNVDRKQDTNLILVYSPIGGSGKTTVAMGVSLALSQMGKKVLYVNAETIQNFQSFLNDKQYISNGFERHLAIHEDGLLSYLNGAVGTEEFDYIRPTRHSTLSYGIKQEDYLYFFDKLIPARFYDCVVVDVASTLDTFTCAMMEKSNRVMIVLNQSALATYKAERLLENIDYSDHNKFIFICNKYKNIEDNHLLTSDLLGKCTITEYVDYDQMLEQVGSISNINRMHLLKSTAYLLV